MTDNLPEGSLDFVELMHLEDEEAEYIARWMALAFSKTDGCVYIATGKTYAEDPEAHYLFQRSMLDRVRALPEGRYITNKPRTVIRAIYGPGRRDRRIDADLVTPYDDHWNLFLERCGGKLGFKQRFGPMTAGIDALLAKMYGESRGVEHFSTGGLAVHPDHQFKGIGSALHRYIVDQARDQGKKLFFFSTETVVPHYEKVGCKIIGDKIPTGIDEKGLKAYPPGNEFLRLCEVSSPHGR